MSDMLLMLDCSRKLSQSLCKRLEPDADRLSPGVGHIAQHVVRDVC